MVGLFRKESLKSGFGDARWLGFLNWYQSFFINLSMKKNHRELYKNIRRIKLFIRRVECFDILAAYNAVVSHIEGSKKYEKDFA